jgi:hypothetical protein
MNAIAIAKYSSESLGRISMESLERVFPLEVRGVVSRRFKVGNTAGEYTVPDAVVLHREQKCMDKLLRGGQKFRDK